MHGPSFSLAGILLVFASVWSASSGSAQPASAGRPRIFLDCGVDCSDAFYRRSLDYFDWVRDRHEADIAISVVSKVASHGGLTHTVTLWRPRQAISANIVRAVKMQPNESPATERDLLLRAMMLCLFDALRGTPHEEAFTITVRHTDAAADPTPIEDGWDHWVFAPEVNAIFEGEDNFALMDADAALSIRRISEWSKFRSTSTFTRRYIWYKLDDGEVADGDTNAFVQRFVYAHTIGGHGALGATAAASRDEYSNLKLHLRGGPMLEWNVFPYEENSSRQLSFAYQVGAWYSRYFERTVFDRFSDVRPYHAVSMIADVNQPWGSVQSVLQVNSFIDEPKRWRLATELVVSLSLVSGLALMIEGKVEWIHDQIALRERELTDREIFLELVELQKEITYSAEIGFAYTFGSVHNTVVNPRFGRIDLEEE